MLTISSDSIQFKPNIPVSLVCCKEAPNEKGKQMYDEDDCCCEKNTSPDERKAAFLNTQLYNAVNLKEGELQKAFKMDLQTRPMDPKEFVQWVKEDWFKFDPELNEDGSYRSEAQRWHCRHSSDYLLWNNPNRDASGYDAAYAKLTEAEKKTGRVIHVSTPAEGLAALEAFESTTFH